MSSASSPTPRSGRRRQGAPAAKAWSGRGRPPTRLRRDAGHRRWRSRQLARSLPAEAWQDVAWREGSQGRCSARASPPCGCDRGIATTIGRALARALAAGRVAARTRREPTKYWFANLPQRHAARRLVRLAKLRWRIERDYQELKQELGLGHFEGRGWRGFHHHAALCIAAYGFLVRERLATSPSSDGGTDPVRPSLPALPEGFAPRGRPHQSRAPRRQLDRHDASRDRRSPRPALASMSVLFAHPAHRSSNSFMTQ